MTPETKTPPPPFQPSRRGFLAGTATAAALAGFARPAEAQTNTQTQPMDSYQPEFLTAAEWAFVIAATARIIPSEGDGPGAIEAQVPVFIDRQLAGDFGAASDLYMEGPFVADADANFGLQTPLTPAEVYRQGIAAFDQWCQQSQGGSFADLDEGAQDAALTALSRGEAGLVPEIKDFWSHLLQNTREGYFADPMYGGNAGMQAWVHIGYPGARANFLEWVGRDEPYPMGPVNIAGERA